MNKLHPRLSLLPAPVTIRPTLPRFAAAHAFWRVARVLFATAVLLVLFAIFSDFRVR